MAWLKEGLLWAWASIEASLDWSPSPLKAPKARAWEVSLKGFLVVTCADTALRMLDCCKDPTCFCCMHSMQRDSLGINVHLRFMNENRK